MPEQKSAGAKAPVRDQTMPRYTYPPANAGNGTVTVRTDDKHKTSVQLNGNAAF